MDRWNIVATLNYLPHDEEMKIVLAKSPSYDNEAGRKSGGRHGAAGRPDPRGLRQRRYLHGDVARAR